MKKTIHIEVYAGKEGGQIREFIKGTYQGLGDGSMIKLGERTIELDAPAEDAKLREWWLTKRSGSQAYSAWMSENDARSNNASGFEAIHVVELPPGHRVLSEKQIREAWKKHTDHWTYGSYYKDFIRALGFGGSHD